MTLVESGDRLGGSAWFSQLTTPPNGPLLDWQSHELERLGVDVRLGHRATADSSPRAGFTAHTGVSSQKFCSTQT